MLPPEFSQLSTNRDSSRTCRSCFQDLRLVAISHHHSAPALHNRDKQERTTQTTTVVKLATAHFSGRKRQRRYWCVDESRIAQPRAPRVQRCEWSSPRD